MNMNTQSFFVLTDIVVVTVFINFSYMIYVGTFSHHWFLPFLLHVVLSGVLLFNSVVNKLLKRQSGKTKTTTVTEISDTQKLQGNQKEKKEKNCCKPNPVLPEHSPFITPQCDISPQN